MLRLSFRLKLTAVVTFHREFIYSGRLLIEFGINSQYFSFIIHTAVNYAVKDFVSLILFIEIQYWISLFMLRPFSCTRLLFFVIIVFIDRVWISNKRGFWKIILKIDVSRIASRQLRVVGRQTGGSEFNNWNW